MEKEKKPLGKDKYGVQKTMRAGDYLGDGVGQVALTIINTLVGQLTYFYTEKVGLAAAMVATVMLVPKIFDAFTDLIMGKIVDNSHSEKGKCRPWFLRMAIPTTINIILLFTIPRNASSITQIIYIFITNTVLSAILCTAIGIPYGAILSMRTQSSEERGNMGIVRSIFNMGCGMVLNISIIPLTNMLGGGQKAWIIFSAIMAVIVGVSLLITYRTEKEGSGQVTSIPTESPEELSEENISFLDSLKYLLKNKFWVIMALACVISNINYGISNGSMTYYAKYILGDDNLVAVLSAAGMLPTLLGFIFIQPVIKKFGMRNTAIAGFVLGMAGCLVRILSPQNMVICMISIVLNGFAMVPFMCVQGAMLNNCVEYNEWKFGVRLVGLTNSVNSFAGKVSGAVGASLIGWILALFGYQTGVAAASQPISVQTGVMVFSVYLPVVLYGVMAILMKMNTLEKDYGKIVAELNERRQAK